MTSAPSFNIMTQFLLLMLIIVKTCKQTWDWSREQLPFLFVQSPSGERSGQETKSVNVGPHLMFGFKNNVQILQQRK